MTVLEQRFLEIVPRELRRLNDNIEQMIKILRNNGISRSMDEVRDNEVNDGC